MLIGKANDILNSFFPRKNVVRELRLWRKEIQTPSVVGSLECRKQTWLNIWTKKGCNIGNKTFTKSLGGLGVWALDWASRNDSRILQNWPTRGAISSEVTARATNTRKTHCWSCVHGITWTARRLENGLWEPKKDPMSLLCSWPMTTRSLKNQEMFSTFQCSCKDI